MPQLNKINSKIYKNQAGFTLIEALITMIIIVVSFVGLITLQILTTARMIDTSQRYLAEKYMDSLLTEMSTSDYEWYSGSNLKNDSPFFKKVDSSFPNESSACNPTTKDAKDLARAFLSCWSKNIVSTMAVDQDLLQKYYFICQSKDGENCSSDGALVLVQMAWYSKDCKKMKYVSFNSINSCVQDSSQGIRLYKVAMQP